MDRKVVDTLCALPERDLFMKGLYNWVSFRSAPCPGITTSKRHVEIRVRRACAACADGSDVVHQMAAAYLGVAGHGRRDWRNVVWADYRVSHPRSGHDVPGWSTLAVALFSLSGLQLISIGVIGEYLARVFSEVKARPGYIVAEDICRHPERPGRSDISRSEARQACCISPWQASWFGWGTVPFGPIPWGSRAPFGSVFWSHLHYTFTIRSRRHPVRSLSPHGALW
jgi:hypothetical protein